ncbi:MAG TPA: DUF2791 family P-loop domain-containing protein [Acetivibrio clariflavus]|nr:DUF2791 family P-loop domain-containing protein [Acetivibrio clariflavus]HPU41232.1 DUF2791 family P-loop domain-containing protein [Acetivibrio clariflavus]
MQITELQASRVINALKIGVSPKKDLDILCVGRDLEIEEFDRCLNYVKESNGMIKFITGEYGTGKSFLLQVIGEMAKEKGFVVSKIQVDQGMKFNKLDDIYYAIMHNLSAKGIFNSESSFEDLFRRWIEKLKDDDAKAEKIKTVIEEIVQYNSAFAIAFTSYIRARINNDLELASISSAWIKGEKSLAAAAKARFNVKSAVDRTNALDFLRTFIKLLTLIGYSGLLVLVDEMELVVEERRDIRNSAYEILRTLIDLCASGELSNCMFVFAGTNQLFEDEERGIRTYSALQKRIVSDFDRRDSSLRDLRRPVVKIKGLGTEELFRLTKNIIFIHKQLYKWTPFLRDETIKEYVELTYRRFGNKLSGVNIREYLKKLVDILDLMEQNPGNNLLEKEVELLRMHNREVKPYVNKNLHDSYIENDSKDITLA